MSRKQEIESVEILGEKIGYGNLMDIASALWAMKLIHKYGVGVGVGAFVPTLLPFMKDADMEHAINQRRLRIAEIERFKTNAAA